MPQLTLRAALIAALVTTPVSSASAESGRLIKIRAVRVPSVALDKLIAQGARPTTLDKATYPDLAALTADRVVTTLCGEVRDGYIAGLEEMNGSTLTQYFGSAKLPLDKALGQAAYEIQWPACLIANSAPAPITIGVGQWPDKIYKQLTGNTGSRREIERFFSAPYEALAAKKLGDSLHPAERTVASEIIVENADLANKVEEMQELAAKASNLEARVVTETDNSKEPALLIGTGAVAELDRPAECAEAQPAVPHYAARVEAAFRFTAKRLKDRTIPMGSVEIMVVDNGFLGALKSASGITVRPGFIKELIAARYAGNVGPALFKPARSPLLDTPIPWREVAGHGTHVAGLAMGGPLLAPRVRDLFAGSLQASPLTVSMVNIGDGQRQLLKGSADELRKLSGLTAFRIMNFSLEYTDTADSEIQENFRFIFRDKNSANLYVAAAGNLGRDVAGRFPAAFGGPSSRNVVTVAATLPDGTLAAFSNTGEDFIDIAAPGCDIASTIDQNATIRGMSGTSQAAPQVSFAAGLVRILGNLNAPAIKARLLASGSLIAAPPPAVKTQRQPSLVASRSALDVERALYLYDDYLHLDDGREYLGSVYSLIDARCSSANGLSQAKAETDIWAFKKNDNGGWLVTGRNSAEPVANSPCAWTVGSGQLAFRPRFRIWDDGIKPLADDDPAGSGDQATVDLPLATVSRLIFGLDIDKTHLSF